MVSVYPTNRTYRYLEFCQNSSQESKWRTIYFQSKWRLSFDAIFAFIPRIGHSKNIALALLHYCGSQYYKSLTWNVVVISVFFDYLQFDEISSQKKRKLKKIILMHFLQCFVLHFVLFGLFWANKDIVSRIHVVMTYCSNFYICVWILGIIKIMIWYHTPKISSNCLVCSDCLHS